MTGVLDRQPTAGRVGDGATTQPIAVRPRRTAYLPGLDGVRALAVAGVLAYHFQAPWAGGGFLGVDIFFVLSGYLISSQLWARWSVEGVDLRAFWRARILRLVPAVLALIAVCTVLMLLFERGRLGLFAGDVGAAATYTSNWWYVLHERSYFETSGRPPVLQHLWSLAVEEQFYVLWPLVVAGVLSAVPRIRARRVVLMSGSVLLACASALIMGVGSALAQMPEKGDPSRWYFGTDSHAFGLLLGAALAFHRAGAGFGPLMADLRPASRRTTAAGVAAVVVLLAAFATVDQFSTVLYRVGFAAVALVTVVLVAVTSRAGPVTRVFSARWLRYVGRRSYGLYLWHWPVTVFTRPELDLPIGGLRLLLLRVTLTVVLAELSYRLVEQPIRARGWAWPWRILIPSVGLVRLAAAQAVIGVTLAMSVPPHVDVPGARAAAAVEAARVTKPVPSLTPGQVVPRRDLSLVVYGDSVALGAQPALERFVGTVSNHAREGAQSWELLPALAADARGGGVHGDVVVIHTGDNGLVPVEGLRDALDALAGVPCVVLVTPKVPRSWEARAVESIRSVVPDYVNVQLADWHEAAQGHADWFDGDGIHLSPAGGEAYARLVLSRVTVPPRPPATPAT
ncbi:MAG: acyltransferase family protein [Dermatophilaceae bacterium]